MNQLGFPRTVPLQVQLWSRDGIYLGDLGEREDWIWCGASLNAGLPSLKPTAFSRT